MYTPPKSPPSQDTSPKPFSDRPLRHHIRLLTVLLARVLKAQSSPEIFNTLAILKQGFAQLRHQDDPVLRKELTDCLQSQPPENLGQWVRACQLYFNLANCAEEAGGARRAFLERLLPRHPDVAP